MLPIFGPCSHKNEDPKNGADRHSEEQQETKSARERASPCLTSTNTPQSYKMQSGEGCEHSKKNQNACGIGLIAS